MKQVKHPKEREKPFIKGKNPNLMYMGGRGKTRKAGGKPLQPPEKVKMNTVTEVPQVETSEKYNSKREQPGSGKT